MSWRKRWFTQGDAEFSDEVQAHLKLLAEEYVRHGMNPEEAAYAARRQFGNTTLLKEQQREMRSFAAIESIGRDVRYALRQLRAHPLFTAVAVLSLALGIGANTAVFTLLDQLVLRLLPVRQPERLVMIWSTGPHLGNNNGPRKASYPMYEDFQRRAKQFESVFCQFDTALALTIDGHTERGDAALVSGNYFQALGVQPAAGRVFSPQLDDRTYKGHPSVVLNYSYWRNRFGADAHVVGKRILVNGYPMNVVGVAPPVFAGLDPSTAPHVWIPIQMKPLMTPGQDGLGNRRSQWVQVFARLKPGYSPSAAKAALQPLFLQILRQELTEPALRDVSPYNRKQFLDRKVLLETASNGYSDLRQQYSTALIVLMCMAGLILLIACSNVANLLIARAASRQKEIAVRLSLGAARSTLVRQLLVESMLLSSGAVGLGLALSFVTTRALLSMLPNSGELLMLHAQPDGRILLFCIAMAFCTALLFGLMPALQGTRVELWTTLKDAANAVTSATGAAKLRKALVIAQVTLSFLLIAGAGLFAKTLINLRDGELGFKSIDAVLTFRVDPTTNGYSVVRMHGFYDDLLREIKARPDVTAASYAMYPVLHGWESDTMMTVEGHHAKDGEDMQAYYNAVSPGYWATMGVRILQGRDFDSRDPVHAGGDPMELPTVAIVNRKFAEHFFGRRSPIGRKLAFGGGATAKPTIPIIGMVENSLYDSPRNGVPRQVFFAFQQVPVPNEACFYIRTARDPEAVFPILRSIAAKLDPGVPIYDVKTLARQLDETLSTERMIASLSVAFAVLATVLAALGLYGVMAFLVLRRTKEIGLRMALGARQISVLWLVSREAIVLLGAGLLIGVPGAYALARYVSSQLYGVSTTDGWTVALAVAVLGSAAALSAIVPARRATTVDAITALRFD